MAHHEEPQLAVQLLPAHAHGLFVEVFEEERGPSVLPAEQRATPNGTTARSSRPRSLAWACTWMRRCWRSTRFIRLWSTQQGVMGRHPAWELSASIYG